VNATGQRHQARYVLFIAREVPSFGLNDVYRVLPAGEDTVARLCVPISRRPLWLTPSRCDRKRVLPLEIDAWNGAIKSMVEKSTAGRCHPEEKPFAIR